jgi:hypothetical protein
VAVSAASVHRKYNGISEIDYFIYSDRPWVCTDGWAGQAESMRLDRKTEQRRRKRHTRVLKRGRITCFPFAKRVLY